ncbi:Predicted dehydrogenase [Amphibacillus marinus]|uniref:Predicted dehydrogenase n=1 Tax=Amphibacillus marinus TaxID=872970 RepID=A0A1H8R9I1_9BACI|nr:Gfo/Idh/MocA family oxidoreductase [Amphibacillus marinus]SEO62957.1 Predicted dehydrogenase [Amphibacillus marinus]
MKALKIAIVGCGFIAQKHIETLNRLSDSFEIQALVDHDTLKLENAKQLLADQEGVLLYQDYNDMLNTEDIDIVLITTPSFLHGQMALDAIEAGKHVMVEKPLALSSKEIALISEGALKKSKKVLVCHQMRYRPLFRKLKNLTRNEQILGKPLMASASILINRPKSYYDQAAWKGTWLYDGGMLINQGLHVIDLLIWLFGDLDWIYGKSVNCTPWKETDDVALGMMKFNNGAVGNLAATIQTKPHNIGYRLDLIYSHATFSISGNALNQLDHFFIENQPFTSSKLDALVNDLDDRYYMYQDFYQSLTDDRHQSVIDLQGAKKVIDVINGFYQSDQANQILKFS